MKKFKNNFSKYIIVSFTIFFLINIYLYKYVLLIKFKIKLIYMIKKIISLLSKKKKEIILYSSIIYSDNFV